MSTDSHLEFVNYRFFLSNDHPRNRNSHRPTKVDRNRMIHDWDMEIKLFSKWRTSAILNFRKLRIKSSHLCLHVFLHLRSKFCIYRPVWHWDIAKNNFQYGVCPPSWICKISIFGQKSEIFLMIDDQKWWLSTPRIFFISSSHGNSDTCLKIIGKEFPDLL